MLFWRPIVRGATRSLESSGVQERPLSVFVQKLNRIYVAQTVHDTPQRPFVITAKEKRERRAACVHWPIPQCGLDDVFQEKPSHPYVFERVDLSKDLDVVLLNSRFVVFIASERVAYVPGTPISVGVQTHKNWIIEVSGELFNEDEYAEVYPSRDAFWNFFCGKSPTLTYCVPSDESYVLYDKTYTFPKGTEISSIDSKVRRLIPLVTTKTSTRSPSSEAPTRRLVRLSYGE